MSRSALYQGLGHGLMSFGQNLQQQMANSAAQRRQESLMALQRQWQLQDREAQFEREDQRFDAQQEAAMSQWRTQFDAEQEAQRNDPMRQAQAGYYEALTERAGREGELTAVDDARIELLQAQAEQARAAANRGTGISEGEYFQSLNQGAAQQIETFMEQARGLQGAKMNEVRQFAATHGLHDVELPDDANQAIGTIIQEYQRRRQNDVREGMQRFQQFQETGDFTALMPEIPETEKPPSAPEGDGGGTRRRTALPTVEGGDAAHQLGGALVAGPMSVYRGLSGADLPEDASFYERFSHGTGAGLRGVGDLAGMAMMGRQPSPDSPVQGLMNVGREMGQGAYAQATGQPIPGGQQPAEAPTVNPEAERGSSENPIDARELQGPQDLEPGTFYIDTDGSIFMWDGEKKVK